MKRSIYSIVSFLSIFTFSIISISCGAKREYKPSSIEVAKQYRFADSLQSKDNLTADTTITLGQIPWKEFFGDSILIQLIDKAIANNLDMQQAITNIEIANQMLLRSKASSLPEVNATLGKFARGYNSKNYYGNPSSNYYENKTPPDNMYTNKVQHISDIQVSWELDIWGKFRNKKEADLASYLKTQEAKKAVQTELVAEVAKGYYQLLELDAQLEVARANAKLNDSILRIIELQYDAGEVTSLAREQTEAQKLVAQGLIPHLERQVAIQEDRLRFLSGNSPGEIERKNLDSYIQQADRLFNVGVLMELLQYRPDVYAAELDLRRANAEVGVAQSYRYPSLNIDLTGGLDAMLGENWFQIPGSIFGSIAAGVTQPIFNKRRLKTNFEVAKLERDNAEINFQKKILISINEVSDALISMQKIDEQMTYIDRRVEVTQKTVVNAFLLFKSGLANYLEVLTAQSNAMESELDKVNLELQRRNERVNLYRSLGGGWQ